MARRTCTLATCSLNQWAMDFEGNLERIKSSIDAARRMGASYRVGPELEVPGYGCEDHFTEPDTVTHSWECVVELLEQGYTEGIVCDIGLPVIHRGVLYNCRVLLLGGRVLLIRPKLHLANDGNYREARYFATWKHRRRVEEHALPHAVQSVTGQSRCPFGDGVVSFSDALLAPETCEELFTPLSPHIGLALCGVEIISNGSGSHHQLRKLDKRLDLVRSATAKAGGVYLYANQWGCDGGRLYYDGCSCIAMNGELLAQGTQFGLEDVEVVTATVDLEEVQAYRGAISSLREQASETQPPEIIRVPFKLCAAAGNVTRPIQPKLPLVEEEICYGPACWLWDYLRRSGASGFLLPLSGGADSSATAAIVGAMCQLVTASVSAGDRQVVQDAMRIGGYSAEEAVDTDPRALASRIFVTAYLGSENSSEETKGRSQRLADQIGSYHLDVQIGSVVSALVGLFTLVTGKRPAFKAHGGSHAENLALQNIQARLRMVVSFLLAQLLPWVRGRGSGFLLVLGSANVDECLRGYLTKYDCSSADINPIGGVSKHDLRRFLLWAARHLGLLELARVAAAPPTAELEPLEEGAVAQLDEVDMGMSYEELGVYGRLRKICKCGPVSMFGQCMQLWRDKLDPATIANKVKTFFRYYAMNRHKAATLTPAYHAENYSPEDNRFDHRQILYNYNWPWQFRRIDAAAAAAEAAAGTATPKSSKQD